MVCYNGPFQGHQGRSHTVCSTSNGPFQDHSCSHPVCSSNRPFQDHTCSHSVSYSNGPCQGQSGSQPVYPDNGPFQDHSCSQPVYPDNGPFQDHSCSRPVSSSNGPFQDHSCSHPVSSSNGPFQDHSCSHPVSSSNGPFQDHSCSHTVCVNKGPFQDHSCSHPVSSSNGPFQDNSCSHTVCVVGKGPFQDHSGSQSVSLDNGPFQGNSSSQSVCPDNGPFQGHQVKHVTNTIMYSTGRANYIKLVPWNAQGAISKTSAIKTAFVQDDIDIVMIQDTRYKRGPDDLPNLRIQGYHTYHRTMDEGGHGLVTLIKHTIPSEATDQVHLRVGTETLSTRIWINNKPLILHNLYRVDGDLDITTPLTREPRSIMVGDFNARDERWCRANNRAGRLLNEQIQDLDNFCLMNHPQVCTTINKTVIDLSLVPVDMAPLTS